MRITRILTALAVAALVASTAWALSPQEDLGKLLFFDENLSANGNQSCAACHGPAVGFTGPSASINEHGAVYQGSIAGRFGNRKPPSSAYATQSPIFSRTSHGSGGIFVGGNFWDGRATGETLGSPAAEQAKGPYLNPLEQALGASADVIQRVCGGTYAGLFLEVCGANACDPAGVDAAYDCVGVSVAAYEASAEVNSFSSKYDYYLAGEATLTREEKWGLQLFQGKAKCARCHVLAPAPKEMPTRDSREMHLGTGPVEIAFNGPAVVEVAPVLDLRPPLLTDFSFDNLGVPKNPENPFYHQPPQFNPLGEDWIDLGLGEFLLSRMEWAQYAPETYGQQKVPTLRNVDLRPYEGFVKAYTHNGYFKSLKDVVHFYNTRDVLPVCEAGGMPGVDCWPAPEVPVNVNTSELGNLGLTEQEEWALVAFMKTLSDGWQP